MEELVRKESAKDDEVVDGAVLSNGAQTKPVANVSFVQNILPSLMP